MTNSSIPLKNKNTENFSVGSFLIRAELRPPNHAYYNFAQAMMTAGKVDILIKGRAA